MRKIKGSSSYLKNQVRKNLAKAAFSILIYFAILAALIATVIINLKVGILQETGLVLSIVPLITFYYFLRQYRIYNGGWTGEKQVAKHLAGRLNDNYYLTNDLYLANGGGDIDHIVLGPNGVFVLETKNWSGNISCNGDEWQRVGKRNFSGSPSRQVKRNSAKIRQIIDGNPNLRHLGIWVEGIVVLTNNHAQIHLINPTVPVLKLSQLTYHITAFRNPQSYSREQLEAIGKEIVKQKH